MLHSTLLSFYPLELKSKDKHFVSADCHIFTEVWLYERLCEFNIPSGVKLIKRKVFKNYNKNSVALIVSIFMIDVAVKEN
jgi:hypothetical protein